MRSPRRGPRRTGVLPHGPPRRRGREGEGAFSIDRYPSSEKLNAVWDFGSPPRVSIATGEDATGTIVRVLAPSVRVAGVVRDAEMRPLAGASVSFNAGLHQLSSFSLVLSNLSASSPILRTEEDGRFDLGPVPFHPAFRITARHDGQEAPSVAVPEGDQAELLLQMTEAELKPLMAVFGTAVAADDSPMAGKTVRLGNRSVTTDDDGRFLFESRSWYPSDAMLVAQLRDRQFQAVPAPTREEALAPGGTGPFELRFPPSALTASRPARGLAGPPRRRDACVRHGWNATEWELLELRTRAREPPP
ncbi:MAG: hypothetical protein ACJAQ3_004183 [Planctomycetota bacterium]